MDNTNTPLPVPDSNAETNAICVYIKDILVKNLRNNAAAGQETARQILAQTDYNNIAPKTDEKYRAMVEQRDEAVKAAKKAIHDYNAVHKSLQVANKNNDELYRINFAKNCPASACAKDF